jgi:hypothetical protein
VFDGRFVSRHDDFAYLSSVGPPAAERTMSPLTGRSSPRAVIAQRLGSSTAIASGRSAGIGEKGIARPPGHALSGATRIAVRSIPAQSALIPTSVFQPRPP